MKWNSVIKVTRCGEIKGHLLALDVELSVGSIQIVGIYAPLLANLRFSFFQKIEDLFTDKMILIGDFNSITSSIVRLSGNLDHTSLMLSNILEKWMLKEPMGSQLQTFSYHHPSLTTRKSCIDHIYLNFISNVKAYSTPVSFSDHCAVGIIQQCNKIKGPRPWRFLSDMLSNESKVKDIKNRLCLFNENKPIDSWEWIKADI